MNNNIFDNDENVYHLSEEEINSPEFDPDDFAPAPDDGSNSAAANRGKGNRAAMIFAVIAAVFTLIIAIIGVLGMNRIANAEDDLRASKVLASFENCSTARYWSTVEDCDVYAVLFRDKLAGYGVFKTVSGMGGDIEVLTCFDSDNVITCVKVVSENESDGLGDKIRKKSFLSAFAGMSQENAGDTEIDLISGATVSSSAVEDAVRATLKLGVTSFGIAKDMNIDTISSSQISEEIDKTTNDTTDRDDGDDTSSIDTGKKDSSKLDGEEGGAPNVNTGGGDISVEVSDVTTVYESEGETDETTADSTAPDTTASTTAAPPVTTAAPVTSDTSAEPATSDSDTADTGSDTEPPVTSDSESGDDTREPVDNSQGAMIQ